MTYMNSTVAHKFPTSVSGDPKSDARKPNNKQMRFGQVFTPPAISFKMAKRLFNGRSQLASKILDPCAGPGTFEHAFLQTDALRAGDHIDAFEIDPTIAHQCAELNLPKGVSFAVKRADYLEVNRCSGYDFAILNPPYIRQEWIEDKQTYREMMRRRYRVSIPGTSNLYVYFIVKVIQELREGGRIACIVYDSWQSTMYGKWLLQYLNENCSELDFVAVPNQPFGGRMIDATIIYATKRLQGQEHSILSLETGGPKLKVIDGFRTIDELFATRRGLRLKQASFFLCKISDCRKLGATLFVKKIAHLNGSYAVPEGHPEAALLTQVRKPSPAVMRELNRRLKTAMEDPKSNVPILTWYSERGSSWFAHREAPFAPLLFNYYLRNRPRHIFNAERGYADNFYGLCPRFSASPLAWLAVLNSTAVCASILEHSRNQGAGLAKIQLFEYRRAQVPDLQSLKTLDVRRLTVLGESLCRRSSLGTLGQIDEALYRVYSDPMLKPSRIRELYAELDIEARQPKSRSEELTCLG